METKYIRTGKVIYEMDRNEDGSIFRKKIYGGGKTDSINGAKRMSRKLQMSEQGMLGGGVLMAG